MQIKSLSSFFRRMLFATVAIFACALVFLAAKTVVLNINAVTPNDGEVLLRNNARDWGIIDNYAVGPGFTPAMVNYIPYGDNGGTGFYQVVLDNGSGATLPAVCAQPGKIGIKPGESKEGVGAVKMGASEATNAIILMMYLYSNYHTENSLATATLDMLFEGGSYKLSQVEAANIDRYYTNGSLGSYYDALIYAYTHAVVGALYGDTTHLSNDGRIFVDNVIIGLYNIINDDDYIWVMAKNSQAYGINKESMGQPDPDTSATTDDWQNFAWIEDASTYGNLAIRKCMKGTGNECLDPRSGTNFDGIAFEIYNNTGGKIYWHGWFFEDNEIMGRNVLTNGNSTLTFENLPTGKYKVKELNGNTWYDVNTTPEDATVTADATVTVRFFNSIKKDGLTVYKKDKETNDCSTLGKATFVGTKFTVRDSNNQVVATKTMAAGECSVTFTGLEYGTYTIEETEVGNGYNRYIYTKTVTVPPTSGGSASETFNNQVIRGDLTFKKVDKNNDNTPMANIPFRITSKTTKESHIVVTNEEGVVNTASSFNLHSFNTNGYDELEEITYLKYGTWFSGLASGTTTPNDTLGALPYDTYEIAELACDQNKFCYDIDSQKKEFTISENGTVVELDGTGIWDNDCAVFSIDTVATDNVDGDKYVIADKEVTIKDTIKYCAKAGAKFTIKGTLMDKATGEALNIDSKPITATIKDIEPADSSCDTVEMLFTLNALELAGKEIVVFEELYYEDELIISHKDINDEDQTVAIIDLYTYATNLGGDSKEIIMGKKSVIKDKIKYSLKLGSKFTIKGTLMDKKTGEPILVDGKKVERSIEVDTAKSATGETEMIYEFDSTGLDGKEIVIFDEVYENGKLILSHTDINNASQTVKIIAPAPDTGMNTTGGSSITSGNISIAAVVTAATVAWYIVKRSKAHKNKISW